MTAARRPAPSELLTSEALGRLASAASGKRVESVAVPVAALVGGLVDHGLPIALAQLLASFDDAAAHGELSVLTHVVRDLTGREPQKAEDFLASHLRRG